MISRAKELLARDKAGIYSSPEHDMPAGGR